jgi:hypothetical protein
VLLLQVFAISIWITDLASTKTKSTNLATGSVYAVHQSIAKARVAVTDCCHQHLDHGLGQHKDQKHKLGDWISVCRISIDGQSTCCCYGSLPSADLASTKTESTTIMQKGSVHGVHQSIAKARVVKSFSLQLLRRFSRKNYAGCCKQHHVITVTVNSKPNQKHTQMLWTPTFTPTSTPTKIHLLSALW